MDVTGQGSSITEVLQSGRTLAFFQKEEARFDFLALKMLSNLMRYLGQYLEGFGHALWNNNLKENPARWMDGWMDGNLEELITGDRKGTGGFSD